MMKMATALTVATVLALPTAVAAGKVTMTTQMKRYNGQGAYLAFYVTDSNGRYKDTLWISGGKSKYYKHFSDWSRATGNSLAEFQGITGASTGSGKVRTVSIELSNALMDAGYELHIDASVEDYRDSPSEIVVPLTSSSAGKTFKGRRYIQSFKFNQ